MDSCSMIMMNPSSSLCSFNKSTSSSSTMGFVPSSSFSRRKSLKIGGFCDKGQLQYYQSSSRIRCGGEKKKVKLEENKKKKKIGEKLLKGFSRDLSVLYGMGFGLDSEYYQEKQLNHQGLKFNMMSEATELLVEQLKQVRTEDKESKKKIKMEEKQKRKAEKKSRMSASESSSSSSSESSDSESEKQMVVDLTRARSVCSLAELPVIVPTIPRLQEYGDVSLLPTTEANVEEEKKRVGSELGGMVKNKIEVCMGGKCKKAGAARLMEEFERVAGLNNDDIAVCGCKCMGKCKEGPNVRVVNTPTSDVKNPLCLGVGVDDVGLILSNFFEDQNHPTRVLAAAAAAM